jgi:hypothetical protein
MTTPTPSELRALDLLMAEKVMGWKVVDKFYGDLSRDEVTERPTAILRYQGESWHPTESPADAMMVLKKVSERESVSIVREPDSYCVGDLSDRSVDAPTLELAICLFAREVCA